MSDFAELVVLVEGPTEQRFIKQVLAPYLAQSQVYVTPIILDKPGQKGGDVKFSRAKKDIGRHLKQRSDTWISMMVDYYGIRSDWPGYAESKKQNGHVKKAEVMNQATAEKVAELFPEQNPGKRFIPYVSMYEMETLYFSDPECLARNLDVPRNSIDAILGECGEPEKINDHPTTAPSKRLEQLSSRFKKTTTGIAVAEQIGIQKIREACPIFDAWLDTISALAGEANGQA